ncbi:MAG: hypothetical protein HN833_00275 [Elusimicrobiaceae bacterium]|jgi:hypothetical protein|nr:hypothetical protein [Elusimicrobiaceae bacterium]MBT4008176.1 hypothetical protein [Elusimicrobiaceae bacterium]MBT4402524.1 hypothetical protein [Elusimicrobiaceae bacterium]MBT4439651.1 hypothetical protein [Elusimicrobiaceae bacterium]MBT5988055.1 hypothetical protein [Elusimicrobiaceae bacterium]
MKILRIFTILTLTFFIFSVFGHTQTINREAVAAKKNEKLEQFAIRKVSFPDNIKRDPTMSKDETDNIEAERLKRKQAEEARIKKIQAEKLAKEQAEEKKRRLAEELRLNPSKEVSYRIKIQGVIGNEVILNGKIYSVGDTLYLSGNKNPIKILSVGESYVRFQYKGQKFNKIIK